MAQTASGSITHAVRRFYERHSFPGYDDIDTAQTLVDKASRNLYLRLLDDQLPKNKLILELGCGTGQLSNFLGFKDRRIMAVDLSFNSLSLASHFAHHHAIDKARFFQMDVFRPCFKPATFDISNSSGVLHHTANPRQAFSIMVSLTKPKGLIILGLYNPFGRAWTNLRRVIFRRFGRIDWLDYYLRQPDFPESKKQIWFQDQYLNPHESQHPVDEILSWFDQEGVEFINAVPKIIPLTFLKTSERLFAHHRRGTKIEHLLAQLIWVVTQAREGGLSVLIGRKSGKA